MKILICEFGLILFFFGFIYIQNMIILNFMWTWKNYEWLFIMMHEKAYYFYVTEVYKRV